jgi:hypothetical protein
MEQILVNCTKFKKYKLIFRKDGEPPKVLNILHQNASQVAAFDIGFRPFNQFKSDIKKSTKLLYLLGADDRPISRNDFHENVFIIYQGFLLMQIFIK